MRTYLDHNATTTVRPGTVSAMTDIMTRVGNPSSVHADGQAALARVETARRQVGKALCARPEDIVFTSGGTEALNLAIHATISGGGIGRIIVTAIEHEAVAATARASGLPVEVWPVNAQGVVEVDWLVERLSRWTPADGKPVLAMMLASNEIGTIQPVAAATPLIREAGGLSVVDAIQAVGKIPVDFAGLGCDYMAISAHKFGGPQGVGALLASCNAPMARHHHGGGQEKGRRAGTLNVAGIVGLATALDEAVTSLGAFAALAIHRDRMAAALKAVSPDLIEIGAGAPRLPNTLGLSQPGWPGATQVMALDLAGFAISAGSACSSGTSKGSKVGTALGLPEAASQGFVRVSLGWNSKPDDADAFVDAWSAALARISPTLKASA
ncbi:cysteine desulfurase family protein [Maricaulis maris]|uniref:Cysteine desulfurase n=1 Tax=Maricaulis maris TaxID=74318 RepID=A0A495DMU0_9PROT|nr:cysteine desulfurase family protein [Maricaulis maris]RKR03046.1 cysteine desulfurase [Maricaulis maris]